MSNSSRKFKRQFQGVEYVERISYREARKRGAKCLMGILAALMLIVALAFVCVPAHAQVATTNTFNVYSFRNLVSPSTVGNMTTAAQAQCNSTLNCIIVFDPMLNAFPVGAMPSRCANCSWVDYRTPGQQAISPFGSTVVTANSSYNSPDLHFTRTNNSPPVQGAFPLNSYLDPMVRFDLFSQSGGVTGSHQVLLLNMPSASGKDYTTLTQSVTASGSPQTVSVADSSAYAYIAGLASPHNHAVVDFSKTGGEVITVTAAPDSTHITAIFSQNHSSGANIHTSDFVGYKSAFGIWSGDLVGSTDDIDAENVGLFCFAQGAMQCVASELDVNNNTGVRPAAYWGEDSTHRYIVGRSLVAFGGAGTTGYLASSGDGTSTFNNGFDCAGCASNYAFVVTNGGNITPNVGIAIQHATTAGMLCGSNQTPAENPLWGTGDPVDCVYMTAKGTTGSVNSNSIAFESLISSVKHIARWQLIGNQLSYTYDGASQGIYLDNDGGITVGESGSAGAFRLRDSGAVIRAQLGISGTAATLQAANGGTLAVTGTTFGTTTNCSSSASPAVCASAAAGSAVVAATATTVVVNTTAVTANSQIILTRDNSLGTKLSVTCNTQSSLVLGTPYVSARTAATSFTVTLDVAPTTNPLCFGYEIKN